MNRRAPVRCVAAAALIAVASVALAACGNDHDASADRNEVFRNLARRVIVPAYERLEASTADLSATTAALCVQPSATATEVAREAWIVAWQAWNRTKAFRFGPLIDSRAVSEIGFMIDPDKVDALVAGADPDVGPPFTADRLEGAGADTRGLAAIEHLLFSRDPTDESTCAYTVAAAQLVADAAAAVRVAWTDGADGEVAFADQLTSPGSGRYKNAQAAVDDLVNGMSMALRETATEVANAEAADPGERETVGLRGGDRICDAIWSARAIYLGSPNDASRAGVDDLVASMSTETDDRVRTILDRSSRVACSLPVDLNEASVKELEDAYLRIRSAGTIINAEVASVLAVTLSLSDSDGDS